MPTDWKCLQTRAIACQCPAPPPAPAPAAAQVREGTGAAVFNLTYSCICFKPFKGEVLDVVVTSVNKVRRSWGHSDALLRLPPAVVASIISRVAGHWMPVCICLRPPACRHA